MYKFNWTCYIRIFKGDGSCKTWGNLVGTFISSYSSQVAKRANLVPGAPDWSRDVWLWSIRMLLWHNTEWQEKLDMGRSPFYQKFRNLQNGNFQSKFPLNPRIVEFTKYEPFNREFREKIKSIGNSRHEIFQNLGIPHEVVLFSGHFGKWCSFHHWKSPEIKPRIFGRMESAYDQRTKII